MQQQFAQFAHLLPNSSQRMERLDVWVDSKVCTYQSQSLEFWAQPTQTRCDSLGSDNNRVYPADPRSRSIQGSTLIHFVRYQANRLLRQPQAQVRYPRAAWK